MKHRTILLIPLLLVMIVILLYLAQHWTHRVSDAVGDGEPSSVSVARHTPKSQAAKHARALASTPPSKISTACSSPVTQRELHALGLRCTPEDFISNRWHAIYNRVHGSQSPEQACIKWLTDPKLAQSQPLVPQCLEDALQSWNQAFADMLSVQHTIFGGAKAGTAEFTITLTGISEQSYKVLGNGLRALQPDEDGFLFVSNTMKAQGTQELTSYLMHLIGHVIGLVHASEHQGAIMSSSTSSRPSCLTPHDLKQVALLYG